MQVLPIRRLPTSQLQGTPTTFKERKLNFEIKSTDTEFQIEHLNNSQFNNLYCFPFDVSPLCQFCNSSILSMGQTVSSTVVYGFTSLAGYRRR
jgi:hypothetical protein